MSKPAASSRPLGLAVLSSLLVIGGLLLLNWLPLRSNEPQRDISQNTVTETVTITETAHVANAAATGSSQKYSACPRKSTTGPVSIPDEICERAQANIDLYTKDKCLFTSEELYAHALFFADTFLYPNNINQTNHPGGSLLFAEDVKGRIDVTRQFNERVLNTEYIFGLFANIEANEDLNKDGKPDVMNIFGYGESFEIYEFAGDCDQYSFSLIVYAKFPTFRNKTIPFEADFFFKLNEDMQITEYDLKFGRWPLFYDTLLKEAYYTLSGNKINETQTLELDQQQMVKSVLAQSVCVVYNYSCHFNDDLEKANKSEQFYDNYDHCISHLTFNTRLGSSMEGGRDTVMCRSLHQNMVQYDPVLHCPHLGPLGGPKNGKPTEMMCSDTNDTMYEEVVLDYNSTFPEKFIIFSH